MTSSQSIVETSSEYVTATQATQIIDVSKGKMAKLLRNGDIPFFPDPRNERAKLIMRRDLDLWLAKAVRPKVPHHRKASS